MTLLNIPQAALSDVLTLKLPSFLLSSTLGQTYTGISQPFLAPSSFLLTSVYPSKIHACLMLSWTLPFRGPRLIKVVPKIG